MAEPDADVDITDDIRQGCFGSVIAFFVTTSLISLFITTIYLI